MYQKYFEEFYVPDEELKEKICETLDSLTYFSPDEFPAEKFSVFSRATETQILVRFLTDNVPALSVWAGEIGSLSESHALRLCAIVLSSQLDIKGMEHLSLRFIHKSFSSQLLAFRYLYACDLIKKVLQEVPVYDVDRVSDYLLNSFGRESDGNRISCALAAEEEIARVAENDTTRDIFFDRIEEVEESIEKHIVLALPDVLIEVYLRTFFEAIVANSNLMETMVGGEKLPAIEGKELIEKILKVGSHRTSIRLGIKRGGPRAKKGFKWTDESKIKLYRMVEELPTIRSVSLWQYAYAELNESDFNYKFIDYLRTETAFKDVPEKLLTEAIRTWKKYNNTFSEPKPEEKPFAYALRHAISILDYKESKYSTIKKYYGQGKKLVADNNLG